MKAGASFFGACALTFILSVSSAIAGEGLFGSVERWVGPASNELPESRYERLRVANVAMDAETRKKWDILVTLLSTQAPLNQLKLIQKFVNSQPYKTDHALWGQTDYWSSVQEFLSSGGDCEDYALTKYRALIDAGFPADNLRLVLVEESLTGDQHAILVAQVDGRRLVMDNRRDEIEDHLLVSNYRPLYSMNAGGLWRHHELVKPVPAIAVATESP